jgi:hypothetical protein
LDEWLAAHAAETSSFVINLAAAATPASIKRQDIPELVQYPVFMSRRVEDGRERFRLHMGPFIGRVEAERCLRIVRSWYPSAWIGESPAMRGQAVMKTVADKPIGEGLWVSYAVELTRSRQPIDATQLPQLSLFHGRVLYQVKVDEADQSWHALRLGFFEQAATANRMVDRIRAKFQSAEVVGVTSLERGQAQIS